MEALFKTVAALCIGAECAALIAYARDEISDQKKCEEERQKKLRSHRSGGSKKKTLASKNSKDKEPQPDPFQNHLREQRVIFFQFRVLIVIICILYSIWYCVTYYAPLGDRLCYISSRIENLAYATVRAAVLSFFVIRLRFVDIDEKNKYFTYIMLGCVSLAWIPFIPYSFSLTSSIGFKSRCQFEVNLLGIICFGMSLIFFTITHWILFRKFLRVLLNHQRVSKKVSKANEGDLARINAVIWRTKLGFYAYTFSTLFADAFFIPVFYAYYKEVFEGPDRERLRILVIIVDSLYMWDSLVAAFSVLATYYRFTNVFFWFIPHPVVDSESSASRASSLVFHHATRPPLAVQVNTEGEVASLGMIGESPPKSPSNVV